MSCGIHLGDVGTIIQITITDCSGTAIDISNATNIEFVFKKPSGASITRTGLFVTDGTDGLVKYTLIADDIDEIGTWKIQVNITASNGSWSSCFESFKVHRNL